MAEVVLTFPGILQLITNGLLRRRINVCRFNGAGQAVDVGMADAAAQCLFQSALDHLGEAPELLSDRLSLPDEHLEDPLLGSLELHEVLAEHFISGLELAVDPTVALLHARWVPGNVKVEEVPAVRLEVETLTRRVG